MDEHLREETEVSQKIYEGRMIRLHLDTVRLPSGKLTTREIVHHPGAVAILAITPENRVVLVRQFRKPCDQVLIEVPAGKLEPNEVPLDSAKRELLEETGYHANHWELVHSFFTSPGFADEKIYLYIARGLTRGVTHLDEDEFLDVFEADRSEVLQMIAEDRIHDAKTLIALYRWLQ